MMKTKKILSINAILVLIIFYCSLFIVNAQWIQTGLSDKNINCLAVSAGNIFAGADGDGVFLSTNNGNNWTAVNNGLTGRVLSLVVSGTNIFAGTGLQGGFEHYGYVFLSTNNGSSWKAVNNGLPTFTWKTSLAISGSSIFVGTEYGIFLSTNNGNSWTAVNNGIPIDIYIISFTISGNNIFVGTKGGGVFLSTNNGSNWNAVNNGLLINTSIYSLAINGSNIFTGTDKGVFLSINNGSSWAAANNGLPTNSIVGPLTISDSYIFAGTWDDGVFLSTNNGSSWTAENNGLPTNIIIGSLAISGSYIFAGTDSGVWRRPLSEMTGIVENSNNNTSFSIYPNPFSSTTQIKYTINNMDDVSIELFDIYGRKIKTLVSDSRHPKGIFTLTFKSEQLPTGIYFCNFKTNKINISKKLIILQ